MARPPAGFAQKSASPTVKLRIFAHLVVLQKNDSFDGKNSQLALPSPNGPLY
jgi:hypothetical protein